MTDIDFNHASVIAIVLLLILNPPYVILLGKREPNHAAWTKGSDLYYIIQHLLLWLDSVNN
jgi:hypothetical protein